jgi:hypothetical protein
MIKKLTDLFSTCSLLLLFLITILDHYHVFLAAPKSKSNPWVEHWMNKNVLSDL